jgi:tRNA 2-thiouridine synthesizing protein A
MVVAMEFDKELDVRGLNCPLPLLRTKKALVDMASGQILKVLATDPAAAIDLRVFAMQAGHDMLWSEEAAGELTFLIRKK